MITTITSLADMFTFLRDCAGEGENHLFRGVRKATYKLLPSVGRSRTKKGEKFDADQERLLLKLFKQKAYGFVKEHIDDDLALLSIAQHHGLPTRLLDWSRNPLVALYFAVKNAFGSHESPEDSLIYVYVPTQKVTLDETFDPFSIDRVRRYIPRYWNPRIVAQMGVFTVHNDPCAPWTSPNIQDVRVRFPVRKDIKVALNKLGVNQASLFPDVDGIASHIVWLGTNAF